MIDFDSAYKIGVFILDRGSRLNKTTCKYTPRYMRWDAALSIERIRRVSLSKDYLAIVIL